MTVLALVLSVLLADAQPDTFTLKSEVLGQTRRVIVHVPQSFAKSAPSRRYPTIVVFDGRYMLEPVVMMSDILSRNGQMPESVVVAIENTDDDDGRVHDLTPPGLSVSGSGLNEGGDRFLDFIEKELLPALDAKFRTAAPRTLVGLSSGGILTTYAAATRDTFRSTLSLDAPTHLGDGFLGKKLLQRARTKPSPPVRYVSLFARFVWSDEMWKSITAAAPSSWLLHNQKLDQESHNSMRFLGSYLGLRELFRDYSMFKAPTITTSILPAYEKLGLTPPEPLLRNVVEDLLMEGRGGAARAAFDMLTFAYGEQPEAAKQRAQIAEIEKQPPPAETVEGLLATPFPTASELRDYLGVWEGEQWINPVDKSRFELRIVAEGESVKATIVYFPEPGVELQQDVQYLKLTREGLSFGQMNGMRPRGVLVHDGVREGDVLRGTVRFGGINFKPPYEVKHEFELHHRPRGTEALPPHR
ncbi:MAG TPA: alpha/beta hydrolase-fold protein [Thermoanaerobaculia bacterium]|nr:alpha/beta hydrolase-fold protein [Thermoanaerobaculia bacterium]